MKPSNCDADLSSLDAEGNDGPIWCRSHPHRSDDRWTVRIAVMDRSATSRTIAQQMQPVTHHSVSSCTNRWRLQQSRMSTRHPLTINQRRLRCQCWYERLTWTAEWNDIVLQTSPAIATATSRW
ncbi:hypothetical protein TNCV_625521 [Trichonephila clavipes]|nr:hypothetical protein TNCV_625521 [Trichonephila clavipes]